MLKKVIHEFLVMPVALQVFHTFRQFRMSITDFKKFNYTILNFIWLAAEAPKANLTVDLPTNIEEPPTVSETDAKPAETVKRGRPTRKGKKLEETPEEVAVIAEPEAEPKKRGTRRVRKPTEEKPSAASPRLTRHQKVQKVEVKTPKKVTSTPPKKVASTTPKKVADAKSVKFQSPGASSPMRKVFTPKIVFRWVCQIDHRSYILKHSLLNWPHVQRFIVGIGLNSSLFDVNFIV